MVNAAPVVISQDQASLNRYYRFLLADVVQCCEIILNGLSHDMSLAEFLEAVAPLSRRRACRHVVGMYASIRRELVEVRSALLATIADIERQPTGAVDTTRFLKKRSEAADAIAQALRVANAMHQEVRAICDAVSPEMVVPSTRLDTTDADLSQAIADLGVSYARIFSAWVRPHLPDSLKDRLEADPHVVVETSYRSKFDVIVDPRPTQRRRPLSDSGITFLVRLPLWIAYHPRYLAVIAHEIAHPYVSYLIASNDRVGEVFTQASGLVGKIFEASVEGTAFNAETGKFLLREVLADHFAGAVVGRAYLAALAGLGIGLTPPHVPQPNILSDGAPNRPVWRSPAPLAVRLSLLHQQPAIDDIDASIRAIPHAIDLQVRAYKEKVLSGRRAPAIVEALEELCAGFISTTTAVIEKPPAFPEKSEAYSREPLEGWTHFRDVVASMPDDVLRKEPKYLGMAMLWSVIDGQHQVDKDLPSTLAELPEGLVLGALQRAWDVWPARISFDECFELARASSYRPPTELERRRTSSPASTAVETVSLRTPPGLNVSGFVATGIGNWDVVLLQERFRARKPRMRWIEGPAHFSRRILFGITRVHSGTRVITFDGDVERAPTGCLVLSEVELNTDGSASNIVDFAFQLVDTTADNAPDVEIVKLLADNGWSHVCVLWRTRSLQDIGRFCRNVLTNSTGVRRSVTSVLTHWVAFGAGDANVAREARQKTHADVRTATVRSLLRMGSNDSAAQIMSAFSLDGSKRIEPLIGLADLAIETEIGSLDELTSLVDKLWEAYMKRGVVSSVSHLSFPGAAFLGEK